MTIILSGDLVLIGTDVTPANPVIGWQNLVTFDNLSATTEAEDHPVIQLANPATNLYWEALDTTEQFITVAINVIAPVDYVAIAKHNLGTGEIPVSIEYRQDSGDPWTEIFEERVLADDSPTIMRFGAFVSAFEIRLRLQPGLVAARIAVMYVGQLLVLERRIYVGHIPLQMGGEVEVSNSRSESGHFLGRIVITERHSTGVSLKNLTPAWVRSAFEPFKANAKELPFFFAWRPGDYPLEVGYAWLTNDPQPSNSRPNGMMEVEMQLSGIVT